MAASKWSKDVADAYQAGLAAQQAPVPVDVAAPAPLSAEQVDALNPQTGRGKLNSLGKELPVNGPMPSAIAPAQHDEPAVATGKMIPVFNSAGQQIGEKPEMSKPAATNGANNNPFTSTTVPKLDSTGGSKPIGPEALASDGAALKSGGVDPSTLVRPAQQGAGGLDAGRAVNVAAQTIDRVSPADQLAQRQAAERQKAGLAEKGWGEHELAMGEGRNAGQQADLLDKHANEMRADSQKADADYAAQQKRIDAFSKDMANQNKIDPDHWASNASVGQKFALVLASALGGWVSAKTGGANVGLEGIKNAINADIDKQKSEIEARKGRLGDMRGALAEAYKRTGDMKEATVMAQRAALEAAKTRLNEQTAAAKSAVYDGNNAQLQAQIDSAIADKTASEHLYVPAHKAMVGGFGSKPVDEKRLVMLPDGRKVYAATEKDREGINESLRHRSEIASIADDIKSIRNRPGWQVSLSAQRELDGLKNALINKLKEPGVPMKGAEIHMYEEQIGKVDSRMPGSDKNVNEQLGQLTKRIHQNTELQLHGLPMVQSGFARDAHGEIQHVGGYTGETYEAQGTAPSHIVPVGAGK